MNNQKYSLAFIAFKFCKLLVKVHEVSRHRRLQACNDILHRLQLIEIAFELLNALYADLTWILKIKFSTESNKYYQTLMWSIHVFIIYVLKIRSW